MTGGRPPKIAKLDVVELFPTPLWIVDLAPEEYTPLNARLRAEIGRMLTPRPEIQKGANWQTDQNLHTLPAFQPLCDLANIAAKGAMRWLGLEDHKLMITGCWANINPPGSHHPRHTHPNNYLSGTYYVQAAPDTPEIVFSDPRPQSFVILPRPKQLTERTANSRAVPASDGRMVIFPSWLHHHVVSNTSEFERISIAFNFMIPQFTETLAAPMWQGNVRSKS